MMTMTASSADAGAESQTSVPVIALEGLGVALGGRPILKDLRAELRGRSIGLLGPNGAGKTTLIHTLLGFHPPNHGTARLFGRDVCRDGKALRATIGYMPERDAFIAGMSCVHFLCQMGELSGLPPEAALERAHEALFYVGLGEARYRPLESYSLGMKQMAKLAQAIQHGPQLIFLDEPTNGLDPAARVRMIELIRDIRDSGRAHLVLSSHLLRDVEECCDEILILKEGRIAVSCNIEEERRANQKFLLLEILGEQAPFVERLTALGCECALPNARRIRAVLPASVEIRDLYRIAAAQGVQIRRLDYKKDSLEDIFLQAMEGARAEGGGEGVHGPQ